MIRKTFAIFADILAVVGFCLACCIAFHMFPNTGETSFDYQAILVGIIGGIFTLLVGWNIYQMVDWKSKEREIDKLKKSFNREVNFIHNEADYNQAMTYAVMSQSVSGVLAPDQRSFLKYQMIFKGLQALKIFSKFPDCQKEIHNLLDTMIIGLKNAKSIMLTEKERTELLMLCGEIENRDCIESFDELVKLIEEK